MQLKNKIGPRMTSHENGLIGLQTRPRLQCFSWSMVRSTYCNLMVKIVRYIDISNILILRKFKNIIKYILEINYYTLTV